MKFFLNCTFGKQSQLKELDPVVDDSATEIINCEDNEEQNWLEWFKI